MRGAPQTKQPSGKCTQRMRSCTCRARADTEPLWGRHHRYCCRRRHHGRRWGFSARVRAAGGRPSSPHSMRVSATPQRTRIVMMMMMVMTVLVHSRVRWMTGRSVHHRPRKRVKRARRHYEVFLRLILAKSAQKELIQMQRSMAPCFYTDQGRTKRLSSMSPDPVICNLGCERMNASERCGDSCKCSVSSEQLMPSAPRAFDIAMCVEILDLGLAHMGTRERLRVSHRDMYPSRLDPREDHLVCDSCSWPFPLSIYPLFTCYASYAALQCFPFGCSWLHRSSP